MDRFALYILLHPPRDAIGNPLGASQLMRVEPNEEAPTLVGEIDVVRSPGRILTRREDTTYVSHDDSVSLVTDDGDVTELAGPDGVGLAAVAGDHVFFQNHVGLWRRALSGDGEAELVFETSGISGGDASMVVGDALWFLSGFEVCTLDYSDPEAQPVCSGRIAPTARSMSACSMAVPSTGFWTRTCPEIESTPSWGPNVPAEGPKRFLGFPADHFEPATDALPRDVVAAALERPSGDETTISPFRFAAGDSGAYWVQDFEDKASDSDSNLSRYVFHWPTP